MRGSASWRVLAAARLGTREWEELIKFPKTAKGAQQLVLAEFQIDAKDVTKGKMIGTGTYGNVYEGKYFGTRVAIKRCVAARRPPPTHAHAHTHARPRAASS